MNPNPSSDLNKESGEELWRNEGVENVWGTPLVVGEGDDQSVVVSLPYEVWAMNPKTGKLKWFSTNGVQDGSVSASPMLDGDVVISMGGRSNSAVAIRLGGDKGADVTKTNTVWEGKAVARIMTPIVYEGHIYAVSRGIAICADAKTGKQVYKERLPSIGKTATRRGPSSDYASPVIADGKIYQFIKNGGCYVIDAKPEFKASGLQPISRRWHRPNSTRRPRSLTAKSSFAPTAACTALAPRSSRQLSTTGTLRR